MSDKIVDFYTKREFLTAGQCNAEGELPLSAFVGRLIEVATAHANAADFGYARLIQHGCSWVLSRVSAEITRLPGINEWFELTTWVEDIGRLMTTRCFRMTDDEGSVFAEVRTAWCAINIESRRPADLRVLQPDISDYVNDRLRCPLAPAPKPRKVVDADRVTDYRFCYSDIDFNRHVNSCRYVALLLDSWDMDFFDRNRVQAFDIVFHHEAREGERARVIVRTEGNVAHTEIAGSEAPYCMCRLTFASR